MATCVKCKKNVSTGVVVCSSCYQDGFSEWEEIEREENWITFRCKNCGKIENLDLWIADDIKPNFCSNCGKDMRNEANSAKQTFKA